MASSSSLPPSISNNHFLIEYCSSCDGGRQEFQVASNLIKDIFPDAEIEEKKYDTYPITVTITYTPRSYVVWKGDQRELYRKYGHPASYAIREALEKLKKSAL
eukprot:CAMPEP_0184699016 /NCGR_PEP_ID=MMETSP0313-20130426/5428_1 /TAXON_ID=2792 /ORGANISM="Porphyridium aerugineum, Strain SAG 1380-2" /LENGTH=102 /DNA_ID=CAMNT_0027158033 /DNA_START=322 /DNA_END=633 /DNA_ORIENTATION=-